MKAAALACIATAAFLACIGCKSPYVAAVITNQSGAAVTLVEVDYPSASFGCDALAADASFSYRFKILGSGSTKILWTDAANHNHTSAGPDLNQGQQGPLTITITPTGATWNAHLKP